MESVAPDTIRRIQDGLFTDKRIGTLDIGAKRSVKFGFVLGSGAPKMEMESFCTDQVLD
jgi:hypothetical protein